MKRHLYILTVVLGLIALSLSTTVTAEVRKSGSGICHVEGESRYYDNLKHYDVYDSVTDCLNPDGRTRKRDEYAPKYFRQYFGNSWADLDGDGQNARAEALIDSSTGPITFRTERERVVDRGRWISPFTNEVIFDASDVDIDHVVPLYFAWYHGAHSWDFEKRMAFANDPRNLIVVESSLNRSKGAKSPLEWLPPENQCAYTLKFIRITKLYGIKLTTDEQEEFDIVRNEICK